MLLLPYTWWPSVFWWILSVKLLVFLPWTKSQMHCQCFAFFNATIVQGFAQEARGIACGYWILRGSRFQMQPPKDKTVPAPCMGCNETVFCPKLKSLTYKSLEEKKIFYEVTSGFSPCFCYYCCFYHHFLYPHSFLQLSKFKFENILSSPLALKSSGKLMISQADIF